MIHNERAKTSQRDRRAVKIGSLSQLTRIQHHLLLIARHAEWYSLVADAN